MIRNCRVHCTYNFRAERHAEVPRVNTTRYGLRSFRSEAARVWNSLPNELRVAESYPQFRRMIRGWDGLGCKCPLCSTQFQVSLYSVFCSFSFLLIFFITVCLRNPYFSYWLDIFCKRCVFLVSHKVYSHRLRSAYFAPVKSCTQPPFDFLK